MHHCVWFKSLNNNDSQILVMQKTNNLQFTVDLIGSKYICKL